MCTLWQIYEDVMLGRHLVEHEHPWAQPIKYRRAAPNPPQPASEPAVTKPPPVDVD